MYKILIVEDEQIERIALVSLLNEVFNEKLEIYNTANGIEALELFEKIQPDIVMSDINLPGINGLELIHSLKRQNTKTMFLILTSYNYFEYAHEAIKLGVEDFILKPVNAEKLTESINAIIEKIDDQLVASKQASQLVKKMAAVRSIMESDCIHSIAQNADAEEIKNLFSLLNIFPKNGFCIVQKGKTVSRKRMRDFAKEMDQLGFSCIMDSFYDAFVAFVFSNKPFERDEVISLENILDQYFVGIDDIGVGSIQTQCEYYYESYLSAIQNIGKTLRLYFDSATNQVHMQKLCNIDDLCQNIISDFLKFDNKAIQKSVNKFYLEVLYFDRDSLKRAIMKFNKTLIKMFNLEFKTKISIYDENYLIELNNQNPYENLHFKIQDVLNNLLASMDNINITSTNILVKKALAYISMNFNKPITLNSVAEYLDVTPFYISKLLSTHTSKNFTDVVTEFRIEKSKELLLEDKQIKEIAYELGFRSHNYFTKVFKKVTGLTPKEYKIRFN